MSSDAVKQAMALLGADPAAAERAARAALETAPDDRDALAVLGAALRAQGDLEAALAVLQPLAAKGGGSWIAGFELARVRLAQGRSRDALDPLRAAVNLNPGLAPAWRLLGDILMFSGDVAGAQVAYDRMLIAAIRDPRLTLAAEALAWSTRPSSNSGPSWPPTPPPWPACICSAKSWPGKAVWPTPKRCWPSASPRRQALTLPARALPPCCPRAASRDRPWPS